jgi:phosphatidylglycerophosphate synthase
VRPADLLSSLRLGLALLLPFALARGGAMPAMIWIAGAATDYFDGPVARRTGGPTRHGMLLDNAADIALVLGGLAAAAVLGLLPWLVPGAVLLAVVDYARAALEERHGAARAPSRSGVGHAAGVVNYACLGVVCARLAWPATVPPAALVTVELGTIAINLGAVIERTVRRW